MELKVERTKKGFPAIWEEGGARTNTHTDIVCVSGKNGGPKKPVFIRRHGHRACDRHALFIIEEGDVVAILPAGGRGEATPDDVLLWRIVGFDETKATVEEVRDRAPFGDLIQAVLEKASCYHCREPHYAI